MTLGTEKQLPKQSLVELRNLKLKDSLRNLFHNLDEAAQNKIISRVHWVEVERGEALFNQGQEGDSLYILVTGRMKAIVDMHTGQEREAGEISQGECVGEMALITGEARTATVYAIRDCMLVRLSNDDFQKLVTQYPKIGLSISKLIISRLTYSMHHSMAPAKTFNIALVPATSDIPMQSFIARLHQELGGKGRIQHLNRDSLPKALNVEAKASEEKAFVLHSWLAEQEKEQDYVLYEAESHASPWTRQCLRQADKIIIVTNSGRGASLSAFEEEVLFRKNEKYSQRRELVILYPEDTDMPESSQEVLSRREVSRHYNIRLNDDRHMQRLARMILDQGVGLVLSGGGAKGFAHLGIIKALEEAAVPIDMVCGTSMGAVIAATVAYEWDTEKILATGRSAFLTDKPLNDYTLPVISLLKGHKLQKINKKYFGDTQIENLWLNFFCICGNYTTSQMVVRDSGPVWKAVTASVAIPGVLPPVVEGNHLLVDGSVFNNFPVDIMKARYGGKLIGVDLLADKEYTLNYTQLPGGWPVFLSKFLPFLKRYKAPSIAAIMIKSTILSSTVHQRSQVPDLEIFLSPPVANFGFLDLKSYDKIVAAGYKYALDYLQGVDVHGLLKKESAAVKAIPALG